MLTLLLGGAGCGKSHEMMNRIETAVRDGAVPLVIIPDQFSFEFDKTLYERLGMELFNRVTALPFSKIAREIFIRLGGLRGRYADDTVKNVLMHRTLTGLSDRKELFYYARQAKSPDFADSALAAVKELTQCGVSPEELSQKAELLEDSLRDKAADIALIYSEYTRLMGERGYKDAEGDISHAAKKAVGSGYFGGMTVFVDGFKSFTADQRAMLEVILEQCESLTVCLTTEDEGGGEYSVFETVNRTRNRLLRAAEDSGIPAEKVFLSEPKRYKAPELAFFCKNVFRNVRNKFEGECKAVRLYKAADCYEEGDFVCSEIRRLVTEEGYRYGEIAVLCRNKEQYTSAMESAFERYGIPFYSDESSPAGHKALFVSVRTALELASGKNIGTEDWLRYAKTGMTGLSPEEAGTLEDYCYKWSVEGKMWEQPFNYDDIELGAEGIRQRLTMPVLKLREDCRDTDGHGICQALARFFDDTALYDNISAFRESCPSEDMAALSAAREIRQLWDSLCALLETLDRTLGGVRLTLREFADIFSAAVSKLRLSNPPQTLDQTLFMASHTARLSEPRAVFVIGVNEGVFPSTEAPAGLLGDRDRLALEAAGTELSGGTAERLAEERFAAYFALTQATERLYMSYAAAEISGKRLYPSEAALQAEEMFGDAVNERRGLLDFCTTAGAGYYQYVRNYRRDDEDSASLKAALRSVPEYAGRLRYLKSIEEPGEHCLSPETGEKLFGKTISLSASRFEDFMKCPFMYYCKKGLDISPPEKVELNSPYRGNAIHYCLCWIFREKSRDEFVKMTREDMEKLVEKHLGDYYKSDTIGGDYGKTKRYKAAFSQLYKTMADILERLKNELSQSKFKPDGFEYTIRRHGDREPLKLDAGGGITVLFEGTVDRVDVYQKGNEEYVRVVDYKSGVKDFRYADLLYGINMQTLLYLFAITDGSGDYGKDIPAGLLYLPAKDAEPELDRNARSEDKQKALNDTYKMKGAVLWDDDVIKAMEAEVKGEYIPVKYTPKGEGYDFRSSLVTAKQLDNLRKYSYQLLRETAGELAAGHVQAAPRQLDKSGKLPCEYCDYKSVCGNYPPANAREYAADAEERIKQIMDAEDSGSGGDTEVPEVSEVSEVSEVCEAGEQVT